MSRFITRSLVSTQIAFALLGFTGGHVAAQQTTPDSPRNFGQLAQAELPERVEQRGTLRQKIRERIRERLKERRPAEEKSASELPAGDHKVTLTHNGIERHYLVHIPSRLSRRAQVLIALHGGGGSAKHMARDSTYGLTAKSDSAKFIIVFPNGYSRVPGGALATWNAGRCCGPARDKTIDDVGFIRNVIADLKSKVSIDSSRVFAIGMSNGAMLAYRIACDAPDLVKGIMAVAGTDNTTSCSPRKPVGVLHVHALNDENVPYNGGEGKAPFGKGSVTDYTSVPATVQKWVGLNAAGAPKRILSVNGATCDLHRASRSGAPVQLCVTETGGHSWPGGNKARASEAPSKAISANDVMWDFFSRL
jgi:polyhydroxybutyrate depolymerase